jgi:hypothetical protein
MTRMTPRCLEDKKWLGEPGGLGTCTDARSSINVRLTIYPALNRTGPALREPNAFASFGEGVHPVAEIAIGPLATVDEKLARDGLEDPRHDHLDRHACFGGYAVDRDRSRAARFAREGIDEGT